MRVAGTLAGCLIVAVVAAASFAAPPPRPNVILILADDLGYGDLSSYGATDIATPNIDRIANEGIRFTDYYAPANVCSPSRAAMLTGRYPFRSGVNGVLFHDTPDGLPLEEITIAEALRDAGYRTGLVGKWHLGPSEAFMPLQQGFDVFFGVPHSNDEKNFFVWDGPRRIPEPVDQSALMRRYTDRALEFLRGAGDGKPFFLYFAPNIPHVPLYPSKAFAGRSKRGTYGDVVQELDASVGELLAEVAKLGLDDRTIVIFASDNGAWRAMRDWGGDNGGLREGKTTIFEGGQRVPAAVRWPGHVPPHATSSGVATGMDWFPTLVELGGASSPADRPIDGRSLVQVLTGTGEREATPFFYLSIRIPVIGQQGFAVGAVRDGPWKLVLPQNGWYPEVLEPLAKVGMYGHGRMLFDLAADRGEQHDVAAAHPDVVERLERLVATFTTQASPAPVVRVDAAPHDHTGWGRMWRGVAEAAAVGLLVPLALVLAIAWALRRAIRARRRSAPG
jgi:arylsulfatase A-like enzyme